MQAPRKIKEQEAGRPGQGYVFLVSGASAGVKYELLLSAPGGGQISRSHS